MSAILQSQHTAAAPVADAHAATSDTYHTSGNSPTFARTRRSYETVHLLGAGAVGRAFLERLTFSHRRLIAITDSTATVHDERGLDPHALAAWKSGGRTLREFPGARILPAADALAGSDADIVVDASATELHRAGWTGALAAALERGACLALAAKAALCEAGSDWLTGPHAHRVGCNAVLGGTGINFTSELTELRRRWQHVTIVGNASTTTIITALERGAALEEGIAEAGRLGFLEPDPELDLRGADAAVKLAIIAGALTGRPVPPAEVPCDDIRELDARVVRARARHGRTTRLVGRLQRSGKLHVGYEEVAADSVWAARAGQVVYDYQLNDRERRLHIGGGLGPSATATALWVDVQALTNSNTRAFTVSGGAR